MARVTSCRPSTTSPARPWRTRRSCRCRQTEPCASTASLPTDIVVDINGWFTAGHGFTGIAPKRVFDTRPGNSPDALQTVQKTPIAAGTSVKVNVTDMAGVPATGVGAVSLNVGVDKAGAAGFITVYPCGTLDLVSSVNYDAGQTVSNAVIATVSGRWQHLLLQLGNDRSDRRHQRLVRNGF